MSEKKFDFNYIKVFVTAFIMFGVVLLPSLIMSKGIWIYYGDYDIQQIPFYMHVHEAVRRGEFLYDWGTDLGGSYLGCYSFYLFGSPFFWLSVLFPNAAIPYVMPWLNALKYAVMAVTAYAYMKRHLKTETGAFIGALLFAFSGYQGAVLVFNHFHDAIAFFPLYLVLFERLMEKKKVFAFTVFTTFMLVINYYFFTGQVVFLIIYYFTVYFPEKKKFTEKLADILRALFSGLSGVLLAGVYILPAIYYTLGNGRLSQTLMGYDFVAYGDPLILWAIIKNVFMLPDVSGLNSFLNPGAARVSGIGAYLPMFSFAGVIAYFRLHREKCWQRRIMITVGIFAAIPVLNALFSALNAEYYARWYYMPVLIMSMMTASVVEERKENPENVEELLHGANVVTFVTVGIALMSLLPAKTDEGELTVLGGLKNYEQLISQLIFSAVMIALLYIYIKKISGKSDRTTRRFVTLVCYLTAATMFITGTVLMDKERKDDFISQVLKGESPLPKEENFYRVETDENFYNYPMFWENGHSITSFISTIPSSTIDFYEAMGMTRKVTSHPWASRIGLRAILSGKYYLTNTMNSIEIIGHMEDMSELKGYSESFGSQGFVFYENENYIPMGFSFDSYVTEDEFIESEAPGTAKDRLLARNIILSTEDAAKYSKYFEHGDISDKRVISLDAFSSYCNILRANTCDSFVTRNDGFDATINMKKENLLFFSVPYEDGFKAYVDDEKTEIIKADFGFMAVVVPEGEHSIRFDYTLSYLKEGMYLSIAGLVIFIALLIKNFLTLRRDYVKLG